MRETVSRWTDLPVDNPMPLLERRRVIGEKAMISHITLKKGFSLASHAHDNEQFSCVLSGALRFGLGADGSKDRREVTVHAGEVIHLPSHLPHSAFAVEDTVVLDIFSPPSTGTGIDRKPGTH
jgi:quercetin dioxygenase-like cupin family protein